MWPMSAVAQAAWRAGRQAMTARCTLYRFDSGYGAERIGAVPLESGGKVSFASSGSDSDASLRTSSATLSFGDPALWPDHPDAILSPFGIEAFVEYGIVLGRGRIEWIPMIHGPVARASRRQPALAGIPVEVKDRSFWISRNRFDTSTTFEGQPVVAEMARLIAETLPGSPLVVDERLDVSATVPKMDVQRDRWAALGKMAAALGGQLLFDRVGRPRLVPQPSLDDEPAAHLDAGPRGVLVSTDETLSADEVYNYWRASGVNSQATTGTDTPAVTPSSAVVVDDDPASPFYIGTYDAGAGAWVGGRFGKSPRFFASPLLTTQAQCLVAAQGLRDRSRDAGRHIDFTIVPNPALDPGDVVRARTDPAGRWSVHILDGFDVALDPTAGAQATKTRGETLPAEEQQAETSSSPAAAMTAPA